ncbi:cobalt transporter [Acinetobacter haemolyticus]|uniref:cobalt transporter n=1 Tax=Acinetobacter haemolyticus TaxID=29430 RepID=UPI002DBFC6AB|nr:cobalt transporter [Acinetobacter haemolyticus]MEB6677212.1 cobalt transporter [Acinetobacter haemolyticus]
MALEQQDDQITAKTKRPNLQKEHIQHLNRSQLELIPTDGRMSVSFYYIPHMSSAVDAQRVRSALVPFADLLLEHSIDYEARHLSVYHHYPIDVVTVALQRLSLGAELQQTTTHYEPLEVVIPKADPEWSSQTQSEENDLHIFQKVIRTIVVRFKQWLDILLRNNKGK